MQKDMRKKIGIATVVLLAPGGFILGAALITKRLRKKAEDAKAKAAAEQSLP
jgi:hypothetical protein